MEGRGDDVSVGRANTPNARATWYDKFYIFMKCYYSPTQMRVYSADTWCKGGRGFGHRLLGLATSPCSLAVRDG